MTHNTRNHFNASKKFRSRSHDQLLDKHDHSPCPPSSVNLFTLVTPSNKNDSLSTLICPFCSLPMTKPTILPCRHTFCFKCLENNQQIEARSLPICYNSTLSSGNDLPTTITCHQCSRVHHLQTLSNLKVNHSIELLLNTLMCDVCHQLYPSHQLDTCLQCYDVLCPTCYEQHPTRHQTEPTINPNLFRVISTDSTVRISFKESSTSKKKSKETTVDNRILRPLAINTEETPLVKKTERSESVRDENSDPSRVTGKKKPSNRLLDRLIHVGRHNHSSNSSLPDMIVDSTPVSSPKRTCSLKSRRRPKVQIETTSFEEPPMSESIHTTPPITPVTKFIHIFEHYTLTTQHINRCKQRQSELDLVISKLVQVFTTTTTDNIEKISQYWLHVKALFVNRLKPKTNCYPLINYLLNSCCSTTNNSEKQIEQFFEQNDEIKAALQVLSTTFLIVKNQHSLADLSQLFDREEQRTTRGIRRQLESTLAVYGDELSFILERIQVYESRFAQWKNSNVTDLDSISREWTQIIEHDYPSLIEKISNDFISKIPQIESSLVQMLKNMKKRLLTNDIQKPASRRNSDC